MQPVGFYSVYGDTRYPVGYIIFSSQEMELSYQILEPGISQLPFEAFVHVCMNVYVGTGKPWSV